MLDTVGWDDAVRTDGVSPDGTGAGAPEREAASDPVAGGSWPGVMSMCQQTAAGGSAPQMGSSRDSVGSCPAAVSRTGHSRA